jgi:hypothetical protein
MRTPDQRSLTEQMRDVITIANMAGMYDAADWMLDNFFDRRSDYIRTKDERRTLVK